MAERGIALAPTEKPMPRSSIGLAILIALLSSAPAEAQSSDVLAGKFAFNWHSEPSREKCIRVAGALLADFKSKKYRCDLKPRTNSSSGATVRTCTQANGRKEYLIFDTQRACDNERKEQASNE
jgi:hypothetical protein